MKHEKLRKRPPIRRKMKQRMSSRRAVTRYQSKFSKVRPFGLPKLFPGPMRRPRVGKRPIAFKKRFKVPGKRGSVVVSSSDVFRGLNFLYKGKKYKVSLQQILKILKRKQIKMKTRG